MTVFALPVPMPVFNKDGGVWEVPGMSQEPVKKAHIVSSPIFSGEADTIEDRSDWSYRTNWQKNWKFQSKRSRQYR